MSNNEKKVYVDGGRWCKHNVCQSMALLSAYPTLGVRELALLDYIISWSDREKSCKGEYIDVAISLTEIQSMLNLNHRNQAYRIVQHLVALNLITATDVKGSAKGIYYPNVYKIRKAIKAHLKEWQIDKEPSKEP